MVQPPPDGMGLLGYPVTIGEFFGGLGLIVGFLCRFSAASLIVIMIGAIGLVHGKHGFFLGHGPRARWPRPASNTTWPSSGCWPHPDRRSREVCHRAVLAAAQVGADGAADRGLE